MIVLILERAPAGLRGDITRWLIEVNAGVFVGNASARVRDRLWDRICAYKRPFGAILIHRAVCEQGFAIRCWGEPSREMVVFDGLTLVRRVKQPLVGAAQDPGSR